MDRVGPPTFSTQRREFATLEVAWCVCVSKEGACCVDAEAATYVKRRVVVNFGRFVIALLGATDEAVSKR